VVLPSNQGDVSARRLHRRHIEAGQLGHAKKRSFDARPFTPFQRPSSNRTRYNETAEFSTRKSCVEKRMRISDRSVGYQWVDFRDSQETVELMGLELTRRAIDWRPYKKRTEQPSAEMDQARLDTAWI
jgi:hypothetical protein